MRTNIKSVYALFLVTILFSFLSCSKKDTETTENNKAVTLQTSTAIPGQVIIARASFKPATDTLSVFIAGQRVMAGVTDSNDIVFLLPIVPQGATTIDFKNAGVEKTVSINVAAYTPVTQPDAVIADFQQELGKVITQYESYENDTLVRLPAEWSDLLAYLKNIQATNYNTLTASEKLQLATFLQANMPDASAYERDTLNTGFYARNSNETPSTAKRLWEAGNAYKFSVIKSVTFLTAGVALAFVPDITFVTKVIAAGMITKGLLDLSDASNKIAEMYRLMGVATEIKDPERLQPSATELLLVKDVEKDVTIKAAHRALLQSDATSTNVFFKELFSAKAKADKMFIKATEALNKVRSWFGGNPVAPATPNFRTTSPTRDYALYGSGITITDVSNSAIQLNYTKKATSVAIKASSSTITKATPFTFKVTYKDPYTGVTIVKTMNAVFEMQSSETVVIGNQVWAKKNLSVSRYRNGDIIPQVTNELEWKNLKTGAWCWYKNDSINYSHYGKLYNLYAVTDPRGLAPEGYHIPTGAEWQTLVNYLGGPEASAPKLKEATGWDPNTGNNSSGFSAKPGGGRRWSYIDNDINNRIDFSSNITSAGFWIHPQGSTVKSVHLYELKTNIYDLPSAFFDVGQSVRLIKD